MNSGTIREQIINYVVVGTEASSLSGIHISKLVKELGINRNRSTTILIASSMLPCMSSELTLQES